MVTRLKLPEADLSVAFGGLASGIWHLVLVPSSQPKPAIFNRLRELTELNEFDNIQC
jgi:hypothetical protein